MSARPGGIIDAHHHIWRQRDLAWLQGEMQPRIFGEYRAIMRDYPIEEFRDDAAPCGVVRSIYVQANWPAGREVEEAAWVAGEAARAGMVGAIVGFADFARPEVDETLARLRAVPGLRGIRQQLHWHANPLYRFAPRPDLSDDPAWRAGFARLAGTGLVFELQVFAGQAEPAERLVRDFPDQVFVLEHAGMLEDRSAQGLAAWRGMLRRLAARPNCLAKLSGLGTFLRAARVADWRPVVAEAVQAFGPDRCMFGSNFPIEKLWTSYAGLMEVFAACIDDLGEAERRAVLHDTAARVYLA